jgi:hypothetical protein
MAAVTTVGRHAADGDDDSALGWPGSPGDGTRLGWPADTEGQHAATPVEAPSSERLGTGVDRRREGTA